MGNKFYKFRRSHKLSRGFSILLLLILISSELASLLGNDTSVYLQKTLNSEENLHLSKEIEVIEQKSYQNFELNNSFSFELNSSTKCQEIHLNFTHINETKDFIQNGGFENDAEDWDAQNETDITYHWKGQGPEDASCILINLTGENTENLYRPLKEGEGVENFETINTNWKHLTNDTENFTITKGNFDHSLDGSGSLRHTFDITDYPRLGKGNS